MCLCWGVVMNWLFLLGTACCCQERCVDLVILRRRRVGTVDWFLLRFAVLWCCCGNRSVGYNSFPVCSSVYLWKLYAESSLLCSWDRSYVKYLVCVLHMRIVYCYSLCILYVPYILFPSKPVCPMYDHLHVWHLILYIPLCIYIYMLLLSLHCCVFNMLNNEILVRKDILRLVLRKMLVILRILGL